MSTKERSSDHAWIEVGIVTKPHGIKGAVKALLHNPDSTISSQRLHVCQAGGPAVDVTVSARQGAFMVVSSARIADRDAAEAFRGARLLARREDVVLGEGEYLYVDLIGCQVVESERVYGVVADVFHNGASDVLVVHDGDSERLIPLVDDWIGAVDLDAGTIHAIDVEQFEPSLRR